MKMLLYTLCVGLLLSVVACEKSYDCDEPVNTCSCLSSVEGDYATSDGAPEPYTLSLLTEGYEKGKGEYICYRNGGKPSAAQQGRDKEDCGLNVVIQYRSEKENSSHSIKGYLTDDCNALKLPKQTVDDTTWKGAFTLEKGQLTGTLYRGDTPVALTLNYLGK